MSLLSVTSLYVSMQLGDNMNFGGNKVIEAGWAVGSRTPVQVVGLGSAVLSLALGSV